MIGYLHDIGCQGWGVCRCAVLYRGGALMMTKHFGPAGEEFLRCPTDLVEHIAEIEAGWTLPKWWKASDEERVQEESRQEIREMLERWHAHGIIVKDKNG